MHLQLLVITAVTTYALCAPTTVNNQSQNVYDYSKFNEVYDQRQNGSENYKVDVNGVVVVLASPESVLSALTLLEPGLLEGEYPDLEELLGSQKPPKPENFLLISPEKPSSSTTTSLPPSLATEGSPAGIPEVQNHTARHENVVKRKYRIPFFMRPFLTRRKL